MADKGVSGGKPGADKGGKPGADKGGGKPAGPGKPGGGKK